MKKFNVLYKRYLYKFCINPFTYAIGAALPVFLILRFFIAQNFFSALGSTDLRAFFAGIPYAMILCLPALHAIIPFTKNEQNFPCTELENVLAKICSLCTVLFVSLLFTLFVPVAVSFFGNVMVSEVVSSYIVIVLFVISLSSLNVFIFSKITNTGIAFLVSALITAVFNSCHLIALFFNLPEFFSWIVKTFSFAWHFDGASKGIIDTRDIIFYVSTSVLFTGLSAFDLEKNRGVQGTYLKKFKYAVIAFSILLFAAGSRVYKRIDITSSKQFSVSSYTKTVMKNIDSPLYINYYLTPDLKNLYPDVANVKDYLEEYASQSSYIKLSVIDPVKKEMENELLNYGIYPQPINMSQRSGGQSYVYSAVAITYVDRTEVIPFVLNTYSLEFDLTSRLEAMVLGTQRAIQVCTGNGLDLDEDYTYVVPWLESMGFITIHTYLPSQCDDNSEYLPFDILPDVPLLILGTSYFSVQDSFALDYFINNGGKVFISTTPYSVDFAGDWSVSPSPDYVTYLLQKYGVYFKDTLTCDISNFQITFYSDTTAQGGQTTAQTEYVNYSLWPVIRPQVNALNGMTMFWPCGIEIDEEISSQENVLIEKLLYTSNYSWQLEKVDGRFVTNPFYVPSTPENGEVFASELVSARIKFPLSKGEVVLFSDQYAFTRLMFNYASGSSGDLRNLDYLVDRALEFNGQKDILSIKNKVYFDSSLYKKSVDEILSSKIPVLIILCVLPIIVLYTTYFVIYKKRKIQSGGVEK